MIRGRFVMSKVKAYQHSFSWDLMFGRIFSQELDIGEQFLI